MVISVAPTTSIMKKRFLSIVALSVVTVLAIGSTGEPSALELQSGWQITQGEYGFTTITGTVKNEGGNLSYAQITFSLLDSSGAQVGSALANINNLRAGGRWKFEAMCLQDDFKTARLEAIEGW
jgi:hypothetical protein